MNHKISVKITKETLFDFLLYHTYSKASGFLINVLGLAVFILGGLQLAMNRIETYQFIFYFLASAAFLGYTPLQLHRRAKEQAGKNPEYNTEKEYVFSDSGITVEGNGTTKTYSWEDISHTVTTPKTIGFYYGENDALIVPKGCFGDQFVPIMQLTIDHIGAKRVRLR